MPRIVEPMSALAVKQLSAPGLYAVGGVAGLQLQVTPTGTRSWVLRVRVGSKRRDIGLGGYPSIGLAQAREKAREARELIAKGIDPVLERQAAKSRLIASQAAAVTFDEAARELLLVKAKVLTPKLHGLWQATLATYASPVIGRMHVADIELPHILQVLEPIWEAKTETARRLRSRIEKVLALAIVRGWRKGDNPALWKGNLEAVLAQPAKLAKVQHFRALPYKAVPAFIRQLVTEHGGGAQALNFAILTAARSGEVRGATWREIDLEAQRWAISGERMKAGRAHVVPLSGAAVTLLEAQSKGAPDDYVFPAKNGRQLSDMTLSAVTRRMGVNAVPHGFRSSFRDWAAEETHYPRELCEMALAHAVQGVEAAYRRGDLFDKRVRLMDDWANFLVSDRQARNE